MRKLVALLIIIVSLFGSMTAYAAPKTMPDGGVFDAQYYAATYPDVAAAFGTDENLLYQHYLTAGKAEGRLPYAPGTDGTPAAGSGVKTMPDGGQFDAAFYAATYPDVAAVFGNNEALLYQHYLTAGKAEGRLPYAGTVQQQVEQTPVAAPAPDVQLQQYMAQIEAVRQEMLNQNRLLQRATTVAETNQRTAQIDGLAQQMLTLDSQISALQGAAPTFVTDIGGGVTAILPYVYRAEGNVFLLLSISSSYAYSGCRKAYLTFYFANARNSGFSSSWRIFLYGYGATGIKVDDVLFYADRPYGISSDYTYIHTNPDPQAITIIRSKANP